MKTSSITFVLLLIVCTTAAIANDTEDFNVIQLTDRIAVFVDAQEGADQLAINTNEGIVVINSMWSNATASRFKKAIADHFGKDKFIYTINSVDRIDIFGGNETYAETKIIGHDTFAKSFSKESVDSEIKRLIKMWRDKENHAREANQGDEWINTCKRRADELEQSYSLRLRR